MTVIDLHEEKTSEKKSRFDNRWLEYVRAYNKIRYKRRRRKYM